MRLLTAVALLVLCCATGVATAKTPGGKGHRPTLPLRAAPLSTKIGDNVGAIQLTLRPVRRARLGPVRIVLKDAAGTVLSRLRVLRPNGRQAVVSLPVAAPLQAGEHTIRLTGRRARGGRLLNRTQRVFFTIGGGTAPGQSATPGVQKVVVDWYGGEWGGRDLAGFVAPGVGYGEVQCNPTTQWVRFYPSSGGREVAMMNWTYKDWGEYREKSLREAIHTTDTGPDFVEGLNKFGPPEKVSTGLFEGLISDRGPIGGHGGSPLAAPTSVKVSWQWDFRNAASSRCHVEAVFVTESADPAAPPVRSAQVLWRGEGNAGGNSESSVDVPGLGPMTVSCAPGEPRRLTLDTPRGATVITREASEDRSAPQQDGPVSTRLPDNGMLVVEVDGGERVIVASRWKLNDPDPSRNWCAIAAQAIPAGTGA